MCSFGYRFLSTAQWGIEMSDLEHAAETLENAEITLSPGLRGLVEVLRKTPSWTFDQPYADAEFLLEISKKKTFSVAEVLRLKRITQASRFRLKKSGKTET